MLHKIKLNKLLLFSRWNLLWFVVAILGTVIFVLSGFDWWWYSNLQPYEKWFFPAGIIGFIVPVFVPLALRVIGDLRKDPHLVKIAYAVVCSEAIAFFLTTTLKFFTGRTHPDPFTGIMSTDISRVFEFGFGRGGVFWGWPSSHTAVAFAGAITLYLLFPERKFLRAISLMYAFYIGIGAGSSFHWFSDAFAGAIIGTIVASVAIKRFV